MCQGRSADHARTIGDIADSFRYFFGIEFFPVSNGGAYGFRDLKISSFFPRADIVNTTDLALFQER
jgi:hypothetical protein